MLKPLRLISYLYKTYPAAFRRLCVETNIVALSDTIPVSQPPSGGCVLKPYVGPILAVAATSRLQAAVC